MIFLPFAGEGPSELHSPLLEEAVLSAIVSVISTACSRLQSSSVHSHHVLSYFIVIYRFIFKNYNTLVILCLDFYFLYSLVCL